MSFYYISQLYVNGANNISTCGLAVSNDVENRPYGI